MPAKDLAPYAGRWIAWSPDGARSVAEVEAPEDLDDRIRTAGEDPERCVIEGIPTTDALLGGEGFGPTGSSPGLRARGDAMSSASPETRPNPAPRDRSERLELARALFREFHALCFWHSPKDLEITEDLIPFVIKGLRANGGHRGFKLAGMLRSDAAERDS